MTKKKTEPTENTFTYRIKVVPVRTPTKWTAGEWEKNKEALGEFEFTGKAQNELLGYQPVMMAYLNGEKYGIAQGLGGVHENETAALEYVANHYSDKVGNQFKPDNQMFLAGEIVE
jgi:hypothetical protein